MPVCDSCFNEPVEHHGDYCAWCRTARLDICQPGEPCTYPHCECPRPGETPSPESA